MKKIQTTMTSNKNVNSNSFKLYESDVLRQTTGETLRPGGFSLTDLGVERCGFLPGARVLDVGCGCGATVERLVSLYHLQAIGVDPSEVLLESGRNKNPDLNLILGLGEDLPFPINHLDGVFAECALSVMEDLDSVLEEISRVLKPGGWVVINDVYVRNPDGLKAQQELNLDSCIRRALPKEQIINSLFGHGFDVVNWSDHTDLLTQLTVNLIMTHGSMTKFWLKSSSCPGSVDPSRIQAGIKQAKMGYFQLIAKKEVQVREVYTWQK